MSKLPGRNDEERVADPVPRFDDDPLIDAFISETFQRYRDQGPGTAGAAS
jgi:hypothetical protein